MSRIHDVAKEAGVSTATVSRSFGAPDLLSQQTRKKVLEAAERLNYRPRRASGASVSRPLAPASAQDFVGFQFFATSDSDVIQANAFYAPVLAGAQAEAAALGMHLILHTTDRQRLAHELPKMVRDQAVAGMLLVGIGGADPAVLEAFRTRVPLIVLVDNHDATGRHDCILSDGFGGTLAATRYLFQQGHRRIGFLHSDTQVTTFQDRLYGYLCAHHDAGRPADASLILRVEPRQDIYARTAAYLAEPDRPTALVTANDLAASVVMQVCRRLGIDIPGDLSLMGFDDLDFGSHTYPALTTVRVDKELLGRVAMRRLYARLHPADEPARSEPPVQLVTPVSIVLRDSCRPL